MSARLRQWTKQTGKVEEKWQVDFVFQHPNGRRERIVRIAPVQTRRGAEQYERELRTSLLNGTFGKEGTSEARVTLSEFTARFLTYSENNNKYSTVVSKNQLLEQHVVPFFGKMALSTIGPAEIEDFKAAMRAKKSAA